MMKRFALAVLLVLVAGAARATTCSIPFTLVNGTTADATQVMANFNAELTCINTLFSEISDIGNVIGVSPTVIGNLASWTNTSATGLGDSGVSIAALAMGRTVIFPPAGRAQSPSVTNTILTPNGIYVPGTTHSNGLQDALNNAGQQTTPGWSVDVYGGGGDTTLFYNIDQSVSCGNANPVNVGLCLPVQRNSYVHFHGTQLANAVVDEPTLMIDSMVEAAVLADATQIYPCNGGPCAFNSSTLAVLIYPSTTITVEGAVAIEDSNIRLGNIAINNSSSTTGTAGAVVQINSLNGNITGNEIDANEINGGGALATAAATDGLQLTRDGSGGVGSIAANTFRIGTIHDFNSVGLHIGLNSNDTNIINGNTWIVQAIGGGVGTAAIGVDTWETNGVYNLGIYNPPGTNNLFTCMQLESAAGFNTVTASCQAELGTITNGAILLAGTYNNKIDLKTSGTVTNPIVDLSGEVNEYSVNGTKLQELKNGLQYNYEPLASVASSGCTISEVGTPTNSVGTVNITGCSANPTITLTFSPPAGSPSGATNASTSSGAILNFAAVPTNVVAGLYIVDVTTPSAITPGTTVQSIGSGTVTMSANVAATVNSGDTIEFCGDAACSAFLYKAMVQGVGSDLSPGVATFYQSTISQSKVVITFVGTPSTNTRISYVIAGTPGA